MLEPDDVLAAVAARLSSFTAWARAVFFPSSIERLPAGGVFGIKSGDVASQGLLGFKAAGFWASNRALGGEPHQATILLFNQETGRPLCVIDGNIVAAPWVPPAAWTTAVCPARQHPAVRFWHRRSGPDPGALCAALAASVANRSLRERRLGKPDARFEAAIKTTIQAAAVGCVVLHATDRDAAVAASDIVITATPGAGALFSLDAVKPGTLSIVSAPTPPASASFPQACSRVSGCLSTTSRKSPEIGETQWAKETPCTTLGGLLTGKARFDRQAEDIAVFDMTGIALQDLTVARLVMQQAQAAGVGTLVDWPW